MSKRYCSFGNDKRLNYYQGLLMHTDTRNSMASRFPPILLLSLYHVFKVFTFYSFKFFLQMAYSVEKWSLTLKPVLFSAWFEPLL